MTLNSDRGRRAESRELLFEVLGPILTEIWPFEISLYITLLLAFGRLEFQMAITPPFFKLEPRIKDWRVRLDELYQTDMNDG